MIKDFLFIKFILTILLFSSTLTTAYTDTIGIEEGDVADIEYQLVVDGDQFNEGRAEFEISADSLIEGFYLGVLGMKIGENKEIVIPPDKGYTNLDHELYGKILYFTVQIFGIVVNIRDDPVSVNNNSPTVITPNSTVVSETSHIDGVTDISDLIESESVELPLSLFTIILGIFISQILLRTKN